MLTQAPCRNCRVVLRQSKALSCFGKVGRRADRRAALKHMARARAAPGRRDSIAFTGSTTDQVRSTEFEQGVDPGFRPATQQPSQSPSGSVWAAGIALALGFTCTVFWRQLTGQTKDRTSDSETQQPDHARAMSEDSPFNSVRNLPDNLARSISTDDEEDDSPNSLASQKAAPVMSNSASLEAHAHAVRERLTEQRRPVTPSTDATATPRGTTAAAKPAHSSDAPSQTAPSATRGSAQAESKQDRAQPRGSFDEPLPSDVALAALKPDSGSSPPSASQDSAESSGKQARAQSIQRGSSGSAPQSDDAILDSTADATTAPQEVPSASRDSAQLQGRQPEATPSPSSKQMAPKGVTHTAGQQRQSSSPREDSVSKQQSQIGRQDVNKQPPSSFSEAVPAASTKQQAEPSSNSLPPPQSMSTSPGRSSDRDKAAVADSVAEEPAASTSNATKPDGAPSQDKADRSSRRAGKPGIAPTAEHVSKERAAEGDPSSEAERLHDLITASSSTDDEVPDAFKTFDGNLPDEPEPDVTQKGPQLFQSAPKTDTSLPTPQGPQDPEGVQPKQDAAAQELESQPLRPVSEAAPLADKDSTPDSGKDSESAAVQPDESAPSSSQTASVDKGEQEPAEEDAAQLRQRMQQLRQAMSDKQAALTAAESSSSQSPQKPQQQQQQQASQQPSQTTQQQQQQGAVQSGKQQDGKLQSGSKQQQQLPGQEPSKPQPNDELQQDKLQQQKPQETQTDADAKPARVLPRPSVSSDAATIFVERPDADDKLQSHPVKLDQLDEEAEPGIDLVALAAGAVLPHPDKAETGGEDAFFVSSHGQGAFGVADGVGGWNMEGVDPSRYSRLLMEHAEQAILQGRGNSEDGARQVVGIAQDSITRLGEQEGAPILGSSTICLGLLRPAGLLEMANVGDSGFRVIRGNETVFASEAQQHHFNMPFQLACPGPEQYTDTCESAVVYELELEPGDVVLLATDGVLDNLWDDQIAELVHECLGKGQRSVAMAQECARLIVETAQENSFDPKFRSPWAVDAAKAGALPWWKRFKPEGGKVDDCTAVVICLEAASAVRSSDGSAAADRSQAAVEVS